MTTPEEQKANTNLIKDLLAEGVRYEQYRLEVFNSPIWNEDEKRRLLGIRVNEIIRKYRPLLDKISAGKARPMHPHKPGAIPSPIIDILKP